MPPQIQADLVYVRKIHYNRHYGSKPSDSLNNFIIHGFDYTTFILPNQNALPFIPLEAGRGRATRDDFFILFALFFSIFCVHAEIRDRGF